MSRKKILVISPHADDAEVSMGGTINRLSKEGHQVKLLVCIIPGELRSGQHDANFAEGRIYSQSQAATKLNVDFEVLNLDPYKISFNRELVKLLDRKITEFLPDIIFTQWNHDSHQDHQAVSNATFAAARKNDTTVLMYEQLTLGGITPYSFGSHVYVDISDSIEEKLESVKSYVPETLKEKDVDAVMALAKFRGNQIGVEFAECFEVCKVISTINSVGMTF